MGHEADDDEELAAELVATGVAGQATIRAFTYLGDTRDGRTLVEVAFDVTTPGGGSLSVLHRSRVPLPVTERLGVGATVPVLVSSTDPSRLVVDWDGLVAAGP